ncbi:winged helix-turn-helix domain-containing protein [Halomonas beimenensis]|uniref:winged helix-turn-helix domain-containing protein n=1 Tax=Halomonas beimenensis TaxID=475662 RepID=UPI00361DC042
MTGIDVLESVRAQLNWPIPVIFLTQRDSEADIVRALDAGVTITWQNLLVLRSCPRVSTPLPAELTRDNEKEVLIYGPVRDQYPAALNLPARRGTQPHGQGLRPHPVPVPEPGPPADREMLLERVWGLARDINTRTVDTHMSRLRVAWA